MISETVRNALKMLKFENIPKMCELRSRFLQMCLELHPDKGGNKENFQELLEAKDILSRYIENNVSEDVKDEEEEDTTFVASNGWFARFTRRANIHNVSLCGEAASADVEAAHHYPAAFQKILDDESFHPMQVFNIDETGLF